MRIQAVDENGSQVEADVDDDRFAAWDHFLRSTPYILGQGAYRNYRRTFSAADAGEALMFATSQLAFVEQKEFLKQYQPRMFEKLIGNVVSREAGAGAESVLYEVVEDAGMGKRISPASNDIPFADSASALVPTPIALGAIGFYYNTQDIRAAAFTGKSIVVRKNRAAERGFMNHLNNVALIGEAGSNYTGLYNNASIPNAVRPSGAVWDAATAATIIADITAGITNVRVNSADNTQVTRIVMPIASHALLTKPNGTDGTNTILAYFKANFPGLEFFSDDRLLTLGAGGTKRVVFFNPDDDNMVLHLPMPLQFLPPQFVKLNVEVYGEYRYGGLNFRRITSGYYMDTV